MKIKNIIRTLLIFFHIDITKNIKYDRLTLMIMKKVIKKESNCIDVGSHKGEILDSILKYSPKGRHYAFEPIPYLFDFLKIKFENKATILPYALSDDIGFSSFNLVKNAPAYSGIKRRRYDISCPEIEEIRVETKTLDSIVPTDIKIDFIKIDVEGGEFAVLRGAMHLLKASKPIIVFECGLGDSEYYGTKPLNLYNYLQNVGLNIYTLKLFIKNKNPLRAQEFESIYNNNTEYYFVAAPDNLSH